MSEFYLIFSLLSSIFIGIRFMSNQNIKLDKRIRGFISTKKAVEEIIKVRYVKRFRFKKNTINLENIAASAEFADLFAVALISGLNPRASLENILELLPGEFKQGMRKASKENSFGKPLMVALLDMTESKESEVLKPLIRQMELATNRGTPLAEVSRNFAIDQRNKLKNQLTKQAASKEISMLFPVVFVVLPSVLAVAIYPALTVLQQLG